MPDGAYAPLRGWSAFLAPPREPAANHVPRYTHRRRIRHVSLLYSSGPWVTHGDALPAGLATWLRLSTYAPRRYRTSTKRFSRVSTSAMCVRVCVRGSHLCAHRNTRRTRPARILIGPLTVYHGSRNLGETRTMLSLAGLVGSHLGGLVLAGSPRELSRPSAVHSRRTERRTRVTSNDTGAPNHTTVVPPMRVLTSFSLLGGTARCAHNARARLQR